MSHFTVSVCEFLFGGRGGINRNGAVEIVTECSLADYGMTFGDGLKKSAGLWLNSVDLKRPLEIQTNGGAMGIKS